MGKVIDSRYQVLKKIGEGGMGVVYLAEDMRLERQVAIKRLQLLGKASDLKMFQKRFEREAKEMVEAFFDEIRGALSHNEQVKLSGFGNFDLRDKNQRPGRNPKTGEEIPNTARRVVTFRPGQKLKARVEAYAGTGE